MELYTVVRRYLPRFFPRAFPAQRWWVLGFWLSLLAIYQWYAVTHDLTPTTLLDDIARIMQQRPYGPLLYILFYIFQPLIFFPSWLLTVAAGFWYGALWGVIWTVIASNLSAAFTYLVGRYFAPRLIAEESGENLRGIQRYADLLRHANFATLLGLRLIYLPYDLLSYAAGFLRIRVQPFLLATALGSIPGLLSLVLFGAAFEGDFSQGPPRPDLRTLVLSITIFLLSFALWRLLHRYGRTRP